MNLLDDPRLPGRFWRKVSPEPLTGCWLWTGATSDTGYGNYHRPLPGRGRTVNAHQAAYEALVGAVPAGLELDHLCRVRGCCNPLHLEAVPHIVNASRGLKGRLRTHCPAGHPYDERNTYRRPDHPTWRMCRTCSRRRQIEAAL